ADSTPVAPAAPTDSNDGNQAASPADQEHGEPNRLADDSLASHSASDKAWLVVSAAMLFAWTVVLALTAWFR
ncbi:MAG: hypothetical protein N2C14_29070, partial [Planctomycetales bacterium]